MKKAIIIMAKVPLPGTVKTRMQPFLTEKESAELSSAFLLDAEEKTLRAECESIIAFSPRNEEEKLKRILKHRHILIAQKGKDLGRRMFNAFEFAYKNGAETAVMTGTDSPNFPAEFIDGAFKFLAQDADVVLGATEDGGYYLIGFRAAPYEIFENVEWSTKDVFRQTLSNIKSLKLKVEMLPIWFDVDLPDDLQRLHLELHRDPEPARYSRKWFEQSGKFK